MGQSYKFYKSHKPYWRFSFNDPGRAGRRPTRIAPRPRRIVQPISAATVKNAPSTHPSHLARGDDPSAEHWTDDAGHA